VAVEKPTASDGRVLLRITAAGVTPLDYTILSGNFHTTKVPLVLATKERAWWRREAERIFPSAHV
jgi:NADPH:quinone reductase